MIEGLDGGRRLPRSTIQHSQHTNKHACIIHSHLLAWAGPAAVASGLAEEVCAALLELQSQRPLASSQVLGLLLACHAETAGCGDESVCGYLYP